jgi:FKBP-type peptidyl-prolyl cis-trans isomerase 2
MFPPEEYEVGSVVRLSTGQVATIRDINEEEVEVDLNRFPMGRALTYDIEVLQVLKAGNF